MRKIVLLKIVYDNGTSLVLKDEDAAQMVRIIDGLIKTGLEATHGRRQAGSARDQAGPADLARIPG